MTASKQVVSYVLVYGDQLYLFILKTYKTNLKCKQYFFVRMNKCHLNQMWTRPVTKQDGVSGMLPTCLMSSQQ